MENQPKGLYQKLWHIQKKINGLGKDSVAGVGNSSYQYVSGSKILDKIKPIMNEVGLILKQEIISIDNVRQDYQVKSGPKTEILSKAMMRFTWIDCETGEKDENLFGANGQNGFDKGLGSALTYAERYFLLKFFHIATDEDDIDALQKEEASPIQEEQMTEDQKNKIIKMAANREVFSDEQSKEILEWVAKPRTKEQAHRNINRLEAAIKSKQPQHV